MIPGFGFGYVICAYLPGIPLTLALYAKCHSQIDNSVLAASFVVAPLIFGLFMDAFRHGLGFLADWFFKKVNSAYKENRGCLHSFIDKVRWHLPPTKIMLRRNGCNQYKDNCLTFIANISGTFYHMYEFFGNFCLSCILSIFVLWSSWPSFCGESDLKMKSSVINYLIILSVLSLLANFVFSFEQQFYNKYWRDGLERETDNRSETGGDSVSNTSDQPKQTGATEQTD